MPFQLNERIAAGGFDLGTLGRCRVLLKDNAVFPWFILVPEVDADITELHQLDAADYVCVMDAVRRISGFVENHFKPDKLNVAAIGNIITQLHIHIIARYESDPAWPGVVWGCPEKKPYDETRADAIREAYHAQMGTAE